MLFSSYIFLFFFLPIVLLGYYALGRVHWRLATKWLTLSSLVFYGWWNPESNEAWSPFFVILIVCSCLFNFGCGNLITVAKRHTTKKLLVTLGVPLNIGLLLYYKYTGLFAVWSQALSGWPTEIPHLVMPLAVSFFTFLQIAFLVDVYRGDKTGYSFWDYLLFVTFFPHLIAGPLVHHRELISQFRPEITRVKARYIGIGLTLLILGLFKKVVLADNLATVANPIFGFAAEGTRDLTFGEAWAGALAYTFQLYFDFSGYSDMAIGLSYLFGLRLPLNFNSPYKATSIVDFWRRWHMTLSRFLRDYLYIPLGGNRKGKARRYTNLMITMLLGGLWHGAGVTFALWGVLHGFFLCVNHAWAGLRDRMGWSPMHRLLAIPLTFFFIVLTWVPFRAGSYELAVNGSAAQAWDTTMNFYKAMLWPETWTFWTPVSDDIIMKAKTAFRPILQVLIIVFLLPNTQQFLGYYSPHLRIRGAATERAPKWLRWRPIAIMAIFLLLLFLLVTYRMADGGDFIYYQF